MARGVIDDYHIGDVRVRIEFDSGGPVGSTTVVSVGKEDDWSVTRWFYFDEDNEHYRQNFAEKVATNENYREKCLNGTADWARVADHYEDASRTIYTRFRSAGVMGYTAGNDDEEAEYRAAKQRLATICESLFEELKSEIRGSGDTDEDAITAIQTAHEEQAVEWLREQGHLNGADVSA